MDREINHFSQGRTEGFDGSSQMEDLLERSRQGDSRVFDRLLSDRQYRQTIERIARKNIRGTSVHWEDAAQTAQTKVFQEAKAGKFARGSVEQFYRWAAVVAKFAIIDLVRKEKHQRWTSLDRPLPGTDLLLLDTIADEFDLLEAVERADLVVRAIEAIKTLDRRDPQHGYLTLWQAKVSGKTQVQLAAELGITQGAVSKRVSKRWRELIAHLAEALQLLPAEAIERERETIETPTYRRRSRQKW